MSLLNGPSNGDWATFAEEVVKERDAAIAALTNIAEWIKHEQQRNANRGRGGQTTGDTHPYLPISVLQDLGRMAQLSSGEYTHEYYVKMLDKITRYKKTIREAWIEAKIYDGTPEMDKIAEILEEVMK
jgi:hypothetical protein